MDERLLAGHHFWCACRATCSPHKKGGQAIAVGHFNFMITYLETAKGAEIMAKNGSVPVKITWVNRKLSDAEKEQLQGLLPTQLELFDWIGRLVLSGFRFTCAYDSFSSSIQVSLICVDDTNSNHGLGLSSRHPDMYLAIASLWFKVVYVLPDDWRDAFVPEHREITWD